jgi:two-component system, cell cycle response regulator
LVLINKYLLRRFAMSNPHKIALIGFSSFERATFESFFRLAARRPPGYTLVADTNEADLAVVNADDAAVLRSTIDKKPCAHVMLIGSTDGGTGWATQKRPLNLMKVLTTVELLLNGATPAVATAPRPTTVRPSAPVPLQAQAVPVAAATRTPAFAPTTFNIPPAAVPTLVRRVEPAVPVARSRPNEVRMGAGDFANSRADTPLVGSGVTRPVSIEEDHNVDHILVVDDSDIALKFMRNRLTRFGFRTDLVNSGEEALGRLNVRPYKFVFLDVMMEGLDGYQTCRAIKQRKYAEGKPPVVVMLTSRGGTIDKIRGTLAGCDAYLTKPLNERDLIAVLAKHDRTVARGFQATNFGSSTKSGFDAVTR